MYNVYACTAQAPAGHTQVCSSAALPRCCWWRTGGGCCRTPADSAAAAFKPFHNPDCEQVQCAMPQY